MTTTSEMTWDEHQEWERSWWGDCSNTFSEENKQILYAHRMCLVNQPDPYSGNWPSYDLQGKSVLDIGGGPVSMLLKCRNKGHRCTVADPCAYPDWVAARYHGAGIGWTRTAGEQLDSTTFPAWASQPVVFDEVWIYNVLQHTQDPSLIVHNARALAPTIRVFEWINTPPAPGHPHTLTQAILEEWFGGSGIVEIVNENGCVGPAWHAVIEQPQQQPDAPVAATFTPQGIGGLRAALEDLCAIYGAETVAQMALHTQHLTQS